MRSTFALFVFTLVLIATGLVTYSAIGIVRNSDDPKAGTTVTQFGDALRQHDGKRACALLSASTQSKLEDDRKKPCEQGVLEIASDLELKSPVGRIDVAETSGFVKTDAGDAYFLDKVSGGWRLSAAGCTKQAGDAPYSCALEG
jgi:hypothetical protein